MKTEEIIEGNKLIAEFMEFPVVMKINDVTYYDCGKLGIRRQYAPYDMKFNLSWDWLMPVVEKIETIRDRNDGFTIIRHSAIFNGGLNISSIDQPTKIQATWLTVIEFIKWYNKNQK